MSVKITSYPTYGVKLEIDGFEVPELCDLRIECPVDGLVTVHATTIATNPLEIDLRSSDVRLVLKQDEPCWRALQDLVREIDQRDGTPRGSRALESARTVLKQR